ncbi:hypothetical protein NDS46_30780 (plasmid) [Paenibacillus thiaminolyticus]|uniref:hypothetical protein n=1 Tax=Paenibacillus thiaminolyticus TaxID=49283 RepID=UPI00232E2372|nr:hypothetical protein [Paenibacillus thiaminolyticus]WCF11732.1 hypothetical protein NDS46_30780 [Paenibacillus thiaminolyticus]
MNQLALTLKKIRGNRKGSMAIEIVYGCFLFLMVFSFAMDIVMLGWRFSVISQTNSYIARNVGLQGGVLRSVPDGYPGGKDAYLSVDELLEGIERNFEKAGIANEDYKITINDIPIVKGGSGLKVDYRKEMQITVEVEYEWVFLSNFIPGELKNWITSKRSVMSEFKYRYDEWYGE